MTEITAKQKAIQAIIDSDKDYLVAADVAPILEMDPHSIRLCAKQRPELLKFEFFVSGNRTKIPRIPFLRYIGVNVDGEPRREEVPEKRTALDHSPMTNEELLLAITHEINTFKQEIFERLDKIESQSQDLNSVLQAARNFVNALSVLSSNQQ